MLFRSAAGRILDTVKGLSPDDLVLCLISGGASALLAMPAPGLTLADKQEVNRALLRSGATIGEMNCVRRHLSAIKGGRLAAACHPAKVVTLLISDVPGLSRVKMLCMNDASISRVGLDRHWSSFSRRLASVGEPSPVQTKASSTTRSTFCGRICANIAARSAPDEFQILIPEPEGEVSALLGPLARRVREARVYCEIHPWDVSDDFVRAYGAAGIILSGSHLSAYDEGAAKAPQAVFEAGVPVVTINAELQVTTGSYLCGKGFLTEAEGEQPGSLAALREEALQMGFQPLVYGNMKGYLNHNPSPEDMAYWSKRQGISIEQTTSFTDGTKVQIEQVVVGNGFGATITRRGLEGLASTDLNVSGKIGRAHV